MNRVAEEDRKAVQSNEGSAASYNHIEKVVVVMSGKGGVGKSLVTGLMASALARVGYQVGVLDADITGPSIPMLFGLHGPVEAGEFGIQPLKSQSGVKVISMNLLLASEENFGWLEFADARGRVTGWCGDTMQIDLRLIGVLPEDHLHCADLAVLTLRQAIQNTNKIEKA